MGKGLDCCVDRRRPLLYCQLPALLTLASMVSSLIANSGHFNSLYLPPAGPAASPFQPWNPFCCTHTLPSLSAPSLFNSVRFLTPMRLIYLSSKYFCIGLDNTLQLPTTATASYPTCSLFLLEVSGNGTIVTSEASSTPPETYWLPLGCTGCRLVALECAAAIDRWVDTSCSKSYCFHWPVLHSLTRHSFSLSIWRPD